MKRRFALSLLMLCAASSFAAVMAPLPDTEQGRRASGYLEAFNSGNEDRLREFLKSNVAKSSLAERPVEDRIAGLRGLRQDNGHLKPERVLAASESELRVLAKNDHGESIELDFLFAPDAPHEFLGMRMSRSTGEPPAAQPAVQALPEDQAIHVWGASLDSLSRADAFSGAALVMKNGKPLLRKAWGLASREKHTPNDLDTRFNLGSINKIFTKLAIAQLAEQGKISLDATIDHYLPDYPKEVASKVTVRQLLEHKGGIGDVFGERFEADHAKLRHVADWIPLFRDTPLAFEPGTKQQYSNGGYTLLGAIVERVSGEDYYDYVRRHIYQPLGMNHTDSYAMDEQVADLAEGYTRRGPGGEGAGWQSNAAGRPMRGGPAGGGYSTLGDLYTFTQAMRARTLLRPESAKDFPELMAGPDGGLTTGGGAPGINAALSMEGPYTIIVLSNVDPPVAEDAAERLSGLLGLGGGGGRGGRRIVRAGGPAQDVEVGGGAHVEFSGAGDAPKKSAVPAQGVSVEMLHSGHLPVVSAMVNGQGPFRFAIDTGAGGSLRLDSTLVARLHLAKVGEVRGGDPSGRNSRVMDVVEVQSLEVGGARFEGMTAAVRDYNERRMGDPVDGILGFALFSDCLLTLDYPGNRVKLERGALPAANGRDVLAFTPRHGVPSVKLQVDSLWVDADVDAGSMGGFSLPASYAERLPLAAPPRVVGRARTVSNEFEITAAELRGAVRLGANEFPGATISFQPAFPMANVGSRVLKDFAVTFDQRNQRMRLVRGKG